MSATDNKQRMREIFSAMSTGSLQPLFDVMAEDMTWSWMGTGQWSHSFNGKQTVIDDLFGAVKETLTPSFQGGRAPLRRRRRFRGRGAQRSEHHA